MILRFEEWLVDQQSREDLIGDLARVSGMGNYDHKTSRRKFDEHKKWADIVIRIAEPLAPPLSTQIIWVRMVIGTWARPPAR